jgi:hypothetical protein
VVLYHLVTIVIKDVVTIIIHQIPNRVEIILDEIIGLSTFFA